MTADLTAVPLYQYIQWIALPGELLAHAVRSLTRRARRYHVVCVKDCSGHTDQRARLTGHDRCLIDRPNYGAAECRRAPPDARCRRTLFRKACREGAYLQCPENSAVPTDVLPYRHHRLVAMTVTVEKYEGPGIPSSLNARTPAMVRQSPDLVYQ
jgi:hypothetical protein